MDPIPEPDAVLDLSGSGTKTFPKSEPELQ